MRLADFILENLEPILVEWEAFASGIWPTLDRDPRELRDHAADILRATACDMKSAQTASQQADKSKGEGTDGRDSRRVDRASDVHAVGRVRSGFDLVAVVAEYRALRASVIRLWRESRPAPDLSDLDDVTRFNESIDQSLTEAVCSYTKRVDESRQMFLAVLGHDLRSPLHSMVVSAGLLARTARLDAQSSGLVAQISGGAGVMAQMISDLLDFTGTGLGATMPVAPAAMDAEALCREVVDEVKAANPTRTVTWKPEGDLTGSWDAARLRQVVSNLLGNAIQHGGEDGAVNFVARADGGHVVMTVHNGGPPIPAEALGTIFEPLVRGATLESPEHRRPGSIGLGLYIAREVVAAHGGTIDVESSEDAGTTFTVRLPRAAAAPVARKG